MPLSKSLLKICVCNNNISNPNGCQKNSKFFKQWVKWGKMQKTGPLSVKAKTKRCFTNYYQDLFAKILVARMGQNLLINKYNTAILSTKQLRYSICTGGSPHRCRQQGSSTQKRKQYQLLIILSWRQWLQS